MPSTGHAAPQQHQAPFGGSVQMHPSGDGGAGHEEAHDGADHGNVQASASAAAPLFSHYAEGAGDGAAAPVQKKEKLPEGQEGFEKMWGNHPHNYQSDESQNTSSEDLLKGEGLPAWIGNTCAVRLSTMLNRSGFPITPQKTKAAGITRAPTYSSKTKQYYILAASEMWQYLMKNFRAADITFPPSGIYKKAEDFQAAFDKDIRPIVAARKGIVAFEKIFGYGGTGHVDLFDGETLSDAGNWYPSQKLHLWYTVVP